MMTVKNLFYAMIALMSLYFALQKITLSGNHMETVFAMSWLCLAVFVIGGNLAHYLYRPKQASMRQDKEVKHYIQKKRQRQMMR